MICSQCNKEFNPSSHRQKYCTKECAKDYKKEYYKKHYPSVALAICSQCNKEFTPIKNVINPRIRASHKYCSQECSKVGHKKYSDGYNKKYQESGKAKVGSDKYYKTDKGKETKKKAKHIARKKRLEETEKTKEYRREAGRKKYAQDPDKFLEARKIYYKTDKGKKAKKDYRRKKRISDPVYKLEDNMRVRLGHFYKAKNIKKTNPTFVMVGCTPAFLKKYLEKQFYPHPKTNEKMTWKNHTFYGWHIDHRIPLSSVKTIIDKYKLCHYTNLQPMWAKENMKKGNKII